MTSLKPHLTYANVVATLALVLAVAGGSTAIAVSSKVKKNSVGTKQLKKGSVTADKLAPNAVTGAKIADGNVTASKLAGIRVVFNSGSDLANCSPPDRLLSGGGTVGAGSLAASFPSTAGPNPTQWETTEASAGSSTAYALCLRDTPGP